MIKNWIAWCIPCIEYILKFFTESGSLDWITTGSHCFRGKVLIVILHNWLGGGGSSDDVTEEDFDEMILATFFRLSKFISYQYPILCLLSYGFEFSFRQLLSLEATGVFLQFFEIFFQPQCRYLLNIVFFGYDGWRVNVFCEWINLSSPLQQTDTCTDVILSCIATVTNPKIIIYIWDSAFFKLWGTQEKQHVCAKGAQN